MIVTVFVRRLREGATFEDFLREWEAEEGFGVPTRVINAPSLDDPRDILSVGFVAMDAESFERFLAEPPSSESTRHEKIDTVIESTTLRGFYDLRTEHDITSDPHAIAIGSEASLFAALLAG